MSCPVQLTLFRDWTAYVQLTLIQGLDCPSQEVIGLISHATQDRLKTLVSKLSVIAEHRLDIIKTEGPYQVTDVRMVHLPELQSNTYE